VKGVFSLNKDITKKKEREKIKERTADMSKEAFRKQMVELYSEGKSIDYICSEYKVPRSTFYRWIRKSRANHPDISETDIQIIAAKIAELEEEALTYKKVLQLLKKAE
jgi:transposase-like protein